MKSGGMTMDAVKRAFEEFDAYYGAYDPDTERLLEKMESLYAARGSMSSYELKARNIACLCEECHVHLFRHSPFFFELSSGRERHTWGGLQSRVGSFLHEKTADLWLNRYAEDLSCDREDGHLHAWNNPVGFDHFSLGYDRILSIGFDGIIELADQAFQTAQGDEQRAFLQASIDSCRALEGLQMRFAAEARRLMDLSCDEDERAHYERIACAAERVPSKGARSFYEALCAIVFCREVIGSLEGIGVSTFGHIDRMLESYYEADAAAGRLTAQEAEELFGKLLAYTDARFEVYKGFFETSTTMIIGGCHLDGTPCYNAVTEALLHAVLTVRPVNTKINCRISSAHPRSYFERIAEVQAANIPVLVMQNDDVLIQARVRCGADIEDARTYVSGGCHEVVLQNTEVNTRADTWINLPRILLDVLEESRAASFDAFYGEVMAAIERYIKKIMATKNKYERLWREYDPLPLASATLTGCLETGRDITAGGTKYASVALSMLAPATLIDSLNTIKTLVYERGEMTLEELMNLCRSDFEGHEDIRRRIAERIPKYGTGDADMDAFSERVFADIEKLYHDESGALYKNGRGGYYLPAFYPHDIFRPLGAKTMATPDGRRAGAALSRGCSPSEFVETATPVDILHSVANIDFTRYADSFCAEITLPQMPADRAVQIITALIETFLAVKGSSMQLNLLNREELLEAQARPDEHKNLCVRVCGYSAVFVTLGRDVQDEVVKRAIR